MESQIQSKRDELNKKLDELKELKSSLNKNLNDIKVDDVVTKLGESLDNYDSMYNEIVNVDKQIKSIRNILSKSLKEYEKTYDKIKDLIKEQNKVLNSDDLLSKEEIVYWMGEFDSRKLGEIQSSNEIKRQIDMTRKKLTALNARKNDLLKASKLGLTYQEYLEVSSTLKKKKIYEAIYNELGIGELVSKKDKTKEDKEKIKQAKEEILSAIANYSKENNASVLDSIRALYNLDITMNKKGTPKVVSLNTEDFNNLKTNSLLLPAQVKDFGVGKVTNYVPDAAPQDMIDTFEFNDEDLAKFDSAFQYGKVFDSNQDKKDIKADTYVESEEAINSSVVSTAIDDELSKIKNNIESRDNMSPEEINNIYGESNDVVTFKPEELEKREGETNEQYFERLTGMYDDAYEVSDVNVEYIPGTNVVKPRNRDLYESDEEYANYLENYYNDHAEEFANEDIKVDTDTVEEFVEEPVTDTEDKVDFENTSNDVNDTSKLDEVLNANDPTMRIGMNDDNSNKVVFEEEMIVNPVEDKDDNKVVFEEEMIVNPTDTEDKVDFENTSNDAIDTSKLDEIIGANDSKLRIGMNEETDTKEENDKFNSESIPDTEVRVEFENINNDAIDTSKLDEIIGTNDSKLRIGMNEETDTKEENDKFNSESIPGTEVRVEFENINEENNKTEEIVIDQPIVKESNDLKYETVTVLENDTHDQYYVRKYVAERYGLHSASNPARVSGGKINNALYYRISREDYEKLMANSENDDYLTPYKVVSQSFHRPNELSNDSEENLDNESRITDTDVNDNTENNNEGFDTSKLDEIIGANDPTMRIGMNNETNESEDNNDSEEENEDKENKEDVIDREIPIDDTPTEETPTDETPTEDDVVKDDEDSNVVELTLFRDLDDNNQVYAPVSVLDRLDIISAEEPIDINGVPSIKISKRADEKINELASKSVDPKYVVKYVDVHLKKKNNVVEDVEENKEPRPHVEAILQKLTKDLNIKAKDGKRFMASNIHVAKKFKDELNSGNYLYNIVSIPRKIISLPINLFRKVSSKLFLGVRGKQAMTELQSRLNNLSDQELDVLFDEYRGSQLKTDMNNQINPVILEKLRAYGMKKVKEYNDKIGTNYKALFVTIGEIDALDEQLNKSGLTDEEKEALITARNEFVASAADSIRAIEADRVKANNLLSGGVHGLEEDFKAVSTKLSYLGMRFAKTKKFDNELQAKLGKYGQGLRDAMANDDNEAILKNFMALESEYSMNTEIRKVSLTGTKSVGSKYYTPFAERFDYRDDPFIRDLFTTVAVATSIYSAINAYKVHQIEQQKALADEQATAVRVNAHNDSVMNQVHQTGANIEARRGQFSEGMKAQGYDASLNNSGILERGNLDANNWTFNDAYHAADSQAHIDYNLMHDQTVADIQNTISGYSTGALTEAQALQQMSNVANNAHQTLVNTASQYKQICADYAANHPQFDLHAFNDSIDYLVNNSNAISNMNQSMVDVTNMASTLSSLNNTHMATLTSLPSDMYSSLMAAFATCCYAGGIASTMKNGRKNKYGNEITDMMNDYVYNHYEELTEDDKKSGKSR